MTSKEKSGSSETESATPQPNDTQDKRHDWWRPVALLAAIMVILVLAKVFGIGERLGELRDWIHGLGPWGPVAFVFLYSAAVVAAIPGSALTVAAGALFGSVLGVILVINAATLGRFDAVDIVEADDAKQVEKAAMIIRAYGHSTTETLVATPWKEFLAML